MSNFKRKVSSCFGLRRSQSLSGLQQLPSGSTTSTGRTRAHGKAARPPRPKSTTAHAQLQRGLMPRHVQMISIAGAFGTGLIISSGTGLLAGGPGALLIAYLVMGMTVYSVMTAVAEMACFAVNDQGFPGFATRFADPALGFATGYNYLLKYIVVLANNLTAAGIILQYWLPRVNVAVWITVFAIPVVLINLFHVYVFGETQYVAGMFKLLAMAMLIVSCLVASLLDVPERGGRVGFRYWRDPGAFASYFRDEQGRDAGGGGDGGDGRAGGRFLGVWACVVQAAFAYLGTEVVGVAFGETDQLQLEAPKAISWTFWRIVVFYVGGAVVLGMGVPYDCDMLLGAQNHSADASASPFVIALRLARIPVLPDVVNGCLLVFVLSAACSDIYVASRTLYALSRDRVAPSIFCRTIEGHHGRRSHRARGLRGWYTKWAHGTPLPAVVLASAFALLAYLNAGESTSTVFARFVSLVTVFGLLNWVAVLTTYLAWRRGLRAQCVDTRSLPYRGPGQPYAAVAALLVTLCVVLGAGFQAFVPRWDAAAFVTGYLGVFLFVAMFLGAKFWWGTRWRRSNELDLVNGTVWGDMLRDFPMWLYSEDLVPSVTQTEHVDLACRVEPL